MPLLEFNSIIMKSEELFKLLNEQLVDETDGFLAKIRSLGFFDAKQFDSIIKLIAQIPLVCDEEDFIRIKRDHFHALLYLMPVLINGHTFLADPDTRNQIEHGIGGLSKAFTSAFYDDPPAR